MSVLMAVFTCLSSCNDFLDIDPPITEVVTETVFENDNTAISTIRGIYSGMMETGSFAGGGLGNLTTSTGLSSDVLINFLIADESLNQLNFNGLLTENARTSALWTNLYRNIHLANSVLNGLSNSTDITVTVNQQLKGEALFIRAFCHFYLVNLFGDIPIVTSVDFEVNTSLPRASKALVYEQIINDLLDSKNLLSEDYSFSLGEKVQPNRHVATALLARVYLYSESWSNAEAQASEVINSGLFSLEPDVNNVFLANSTEAIWQLKPVIEGRNTNEARILINSPNLLPNTFSLRDEFISEYQIGDERINWIGTTTDFNNITYYHAFKYKVNITNEPLTEYYMVHRLAELYLIRSEARAQLGKLSESIQDIDVIRDRAGISLIQNTNPAINQADLLLAIERERKLELFLEWGHRWFDLKRTSRAGDVLSEISLKDWQSTDALYPIPESEREVNQNLTQNPGY